MVLLPHENCLDKDTSSIKSDRTFPETPHSASGSAKVAQTSLTNSSAGEKHAEPSSEEFRSLDTGFSPNGEPLVADVKTNTKLLTIESSCIKKQKSKGSGGFNDVSAEVEDKHMDFTIASKQGETVTLPGGDISTKGTNMKEFPSPITLGDQSLIAEGGSPDVTIQESFNNAIILSSILKDSETTEYRTMRPMSYDFALDHVKSTTSSSGNSSKQSPRNLSNGRSFATPLAPISPYKALKENRIERERLARKDPSQLPEFPASSEKNISRSICSSEHVAPGDGDFQCPISVPSVSNNKDCVSISTILMLLIAYISVLIASCWHFLPSPDHSNSVSQSPWIGEHNATKLIDLRLQQIQQRFEKVLVREDWKVLRMSPNVTIETMSSEDGSWPGYIRISAIFQAKPTEILRHLGWLQFDETQKKVDRFHESAHLLFAPSHKSKVMRKTTQRPLVFPKREMTVALCEKTLRQSFTINNLKLRTAPMKSFTSIVVPKGTSMNAMVNVNINLDALDSPRVRNFPWSGFRFPGQRDKEVVSKKKDWQRQRDRKERHMKAYQDMMGWFVPLEGGGTILVFVMQVDLGPDIPRWAFFTAVAATVVWSMGALNKLSRNDK